MKAKSKFVCSECGYESLKWLGKCPSCNNWNTFSEEVTLPSGKYDAVKPAFTTGSTPQTLSEIGESEGERIATGNLELDRVLGGGVVRGSMVLVGGDPGIGKSTLLLQICECLGDKYSVLYVSGEESAQQIKMRANRLGVKASNLKLLAETNLDTVIYHAKELKPAVMIVDSIQTMYREDVASAPGSVSQVREATHFLMRLAKENNVAVFIVGHVTKDGAIAGPKVLEHMVDCVLYFEGERNHSYRVLRAVKNRFGSTNEIGVFEMTDKGLLEVENPSLMLLEGRPEKAAGSAVVCTMEGTRPVLSEIQALVSPSGFGTPRRMATGIDYNRVNLIIAVLEKRVGLNLQNQDAYVNIIGGIRLDEPAVDLATALAITSALRNQPIPSSLAAIGEIGLTGELRAVNQIERRLSEVLKLGFKACMIPAANMKNIHIPEGLKVLPAKNLTEALGYIL